MRYSFWGVFRDEFGTVVNSARVVAYDVRTTTLASIYAAWSGGTYVQSSTVFTNSFGMWQFYVDDADYPLLSEIDIVVSKAGYNTHSYTAVR